MLEVGDNTSNDLIHACMHACGLGIHRVGAVGSDRATDQSKKKTGVKGEKMAALFKNLQRIDT